MNKRLLKRHKRQVARARERTKVSEPDVRTPEKLAAARAASRAVSSPHNTPPANYFTPTANPAGHAEDAAAKGDTEA